MPQEPEQQTETPRVELAAPSTSNEADAPPPMHESDSDDDMPVDLEYEASSDEEDGDATARHPPEKKQILFSLQCKTAGQKEYSKHMIQSIDRICKSLEQMSDLASGETSAMGNAGARASTQLCTKEALKNILDALDKMATNKVQRDECQVRPDELC